MAAKRVDFTERKFRRWHRTPRSPYKELGTNSYGRTGRKIRVITSHSTAMAGEPTEDGWK